MTHAQLLHGHLQRWYGLRVLEEVLQIHIRIDIWAAVVIALKKLSPFVPPSESTPWGLGNAFDPINRLGDRIVVTCTIPTLHQNGGLDWEKTVAFIDSLASFFDVLNNPEMEPTEEFATTPGKQLMLVNVARLETVTSAHPIIASLAPSVVRWIYEQVRDVPKNKVVSLGWIADTMRRTFDRVMGSTFEHAAYSEDFAVELCPPGYIMMRCEGDATELYSEYNNPDHGAELVSHNIDVPAQQLAFLMGLASFCEFLEEQDL